jgi:PERQ amino acid-rich with GYF domain-containing protein
MSTVCIETTVGLTFCWHFIVDNFISMISGFPEEAIADAVYSSTGMEMDGRHFAEEFIRRRKLADKGVVEPSNSTSGGGASAAGGWNEVAKKGPPKEDSLAGFKVANKKKGKKWVTVSFMYDYCSSIAGLF